MSKKHFKLPRGEKVPEHWYRNSWEEKARENPMYAVMTTPDLVDAGVESFEDRHLEPFFAKGQRVFKEHVVPAIQAAGFAAPEAYIVDYGCGMGRVLKAIREAGYRCGGIDISPTMLKHAQRLVPPPVDLHVLNAEGRSELPDECATTVFSFAVVKHIARLSELEHAVREMCRVLRPGGTLALNANSQDFQGGDLSRPGRTENYETYSVHYAPGETRPCQRREYTTWSGVYVGIDQLRAFLAGNGVEISSVYHHDLKKPQGIWVVGKKAAAR